MHPVKKEVNMRQGSLPRLKTIPQAVQHADPYKHTVRTAVTALAASAPLTGAVDCKEQRLDTTPPPSTQDHTSYQYRPGHC